ncbi:response regulator transcription factor [Vibrio parahaemolyticus]|nr:response regulator transcription factor [Vibrio parahaemolyticus]EJE8775162.1 response regulator transcription factor [Vibrio parahaemolyticus]
MGSRVSRHYFNDVSHTLKPLILIFGSDTEKLLSNWNVFDDTSLKEYRWLLIDEPLIVNMLERSDLIITDPLSVSSLRARFPEGRVPIWVVDYKIDLDDILFSLRSGALDCFPISIDREVLCAKLRRIFSSVGYGRRLSFYEYCVCPISMRMFIGERSVKLSVLEFKLSYLLFQYANVKLSRRFIVEQVWGRWVEKERQYVNRIIYRLRRKLPNLPIKPVRGGGYQLVDSLDGTGTSPLSTLQ